MPNYCFPSELALEIIINKYSCEVDRGLIVIDAHE